MSKELTPLEALRELKYVHDTECGEDKSVNERFTLIEKALKALEIIKKKPQCELFNIQWGKVKTYEDYLKTTERWDGEYWDMIYTQEEFDLLKEVLL